MSLKFKNLKIIVFDFDGVFTNNHVFVNENGLETVMCYRSDGIGLSRIRKIGIKPYIVSTETNTVVKMRAKKLKIECYHGVDKKDEVVRKIAKMNDVKLSQICFVGNDINDLPAFKIVGYPIGVNDSFEEILPHVIFKTKKDGGYGAVREICDIIYNERV